MVGMSSPCPFCSLPKMRVWLETDFTVALLDGFPVAEGHTLVIPKQHVPSIWELPETELAAIWQEVAHMRQMLLERLASDLGRAFEHSGVPNDFTTTVRITRWAYGQTFQNHGLTWLRADQLQPLPADWDAALGSFTN
jgi:galactose-1-phosphate uridylyltransferase